MEKIIFEDLPSTNTPISATNLNAIQTNVEDVFNGEEAMGSIVVDDINCKNLFINGSNIVTPGYLDASGNVVTTDATLSYQNKLISVQPSTQYTVSSNTSTIYRIAEYDINGAFISRNYGTASTSYTFTTSANTYFIKMAGTLTTVLDSLQIEKGSTATEYVEGKKIIKEENGYVKENTTFYANDFKCRNMLGFSNIRNGIYKIGDGTYDGSGTNSCCTASKIEIDNTKNYILSTANTQTTSYMYVMYYDASGNYLGYINTPFSTGFIKLNTYSNYANAKYVNFRFDVSIANLINPQFEIGDEKTPYTEYKTFGSKWVSLGSTTSNNQISLPSNFEEIFALVKTNNSDFRKLTFVIPRIALDTTTQYFNTAFIGSSTSTYNGARIALSTTTANLDSAYNDGSDVRSNTTTYWYIK